MLPAQVRVLPSLYDIYAFQRTHRKRHFGSVEGGRFFARLLHPMEEERRETAQTGTRHFAACMCNTRKKRENHATSDLVRL